MDNAILAQLRKEISEEVSHFAEHAIEHAIGGPDMINRVVGESMRHIGETLVLASASYLPIRREELLAQPQRLAADDRTGVLIIRRAISNPQAYQIIATSKEREGSLDFTVVPFRPNTHDVPASRFLRLPAPVQQEIIRQLGEIVTGAGVTMFQVVTIENYFPEEPATGTAQPANEGDNILPATDPVPPAVPYRATQPTADSVLPTIDTHELL